MVIVLKLLKVAERSCLLWHFWPKGLCDVNSIINYELIIFLTLELYVYLSSMIYF